MKDNYIAYNLNYFGEGLDDIDTPAMRKLKNDIKKSSTEK